MKRGHVVTIAVLAFLVVCGCAKKSEDAVPKEKTAHEAPAKSEVAIVLATTTSTHDSGLLDKLIPVFEKQTGIKVKTVAVGTGEALELGRRGEADVLLVHAPKQEEEFIAEGHGTNRRAVMHNDFIVVGPPADPAEVKNEKDASKALAKIAAFKSTWVSRGDRSGTHIKEQALWQAAGLKSETLVRESWFNETGQGMGATLRVASERQAYTLTDRGTFIAIPNLELAVLVEGDSALYNPYHVIEVSHQKSKAKEAKLLADFFVARSTQEMIGKFTSRGQILFTPDALH